MNVSDFRLFLKHHKGYIIGNNGINHKALLKCNNCSIIVIQDEDIEHAVEVTANNFKEVEEGATSVLQQLFMGLDHLLTEDLRGKCYFEFVDDHEHSQHNPNENIPPLNQITTKRWSPPKHGSFPPKATPHKFVAHPNDSQWRLILPFSPDYCKGERTQYSIFICHISYSLWLGES